MTEEDRERKLSDLLRFVPDWRNEVARSPESPACTRLKDLGSRLRLRPGGLNFSPKSDEVTVEESHDNETNIIRLLESWPLDPSREVLR